jgi:archaellum component FlaC
MSIKYNTGALIKSALLGGVLLILSLVILKTPLNNLETWILPIIGVSTPILQNYLKDKDEANNKIKQMEIDRMNLLCQSIRNEINGERDTVKALFTGLDRLDMRVDELSNMVAVLKTKLELVSHTPLEEIRREIILLKREVEELNCKKYSIYDKRPDKQ